jgi:hypothetical protein
MQLFSKLFFTIVEEKRQQKLSTSKRIVALDSSVQVRYKKANAEITAKNGRYP